MAELADEDIFFDISLQYDEIKGQQLKASKYANLTEEEQDAPRHDVTSNDGKVWNGKLWYGKYSFQITCKKDRLQFGPVENGEQLCLMVFDAAFSIKHSSAHYKSVVIGIQFEDWETAQKTDEEAIMTAKQREQQPKIEKYEPSMFQSESKDRLDATSSTNASATAAPPQGGSSLTLGHTWQHPKIKEGYYYLQGTSRAYPLWRLEVNVKENQVVTNTGIPTIDFSIPVVVKHKEGRKFVARVTVEADITNRLGTRPCCGAEDAPLNVDPAKLYDASKAVEIGKIDLQALTRLSFYGGRFQICA